MTKPFCHVCSCVVMFVRMSIKWLKWSNNSKCDELTKKMTLSPLESYFSSLLEKYHWSKLEKYGSGIRDAIIAVWHQSLATSLQ